MAAVTEMVRNIVLIVLLTTILDMLLPSHSMRSYVKVVMGLFILVSLLTPILSLLAKEQDFAVLAWQQESFLPAELSIQQSGEKLTAVNKDLLRENYAHRLEVQMEALLKLLEGVGEAEAEVTLKAGSRRGGVEEIQSVLVRITREKKEEIIFIPPVNIDDGSVDNEPWKVVNDAEEERITTETKNTLSQYFGVAPAQIAVVFP